MVGNPSLIVENLSVNYGPVSALRNISLSLEPGKTLGIVGESGSGKSTMGLALLRLLPDIAKLTGRIWLGKEDIIALPEHRMRRIRGRRIGMIFQDALASLNPVFTVRSQLVDTLRCHWPEMTRAEASERAAEMLEEMGISRGRLDSYPHEFSGGMRQRVMIAAALACEPEVLIADESTSDLDMVTQKQILDLLTEVRARRNLSMIVISHDLGVVRAVCEDIAVLYRGDLVESGPTIDVLGNPQHWYTKGLINVSMKVKKSDGYLETLPSRAAQQSEVTR